MPRLGLGTWHMGESRRLRDAEIAALKLGLDLGMTLIDTAEMYGNGAERVVAEAIKGRRDEVFIVGKVLPENASCAGTVAACERSLKRLGIDRLDLYLLHWPGRHPVKETLAGFEVLRRDGLISAWGVSNFDVSDMEELMAPSRRARRHHQSNPLQSRATGHRGRSAALVPEPRHSPYGLFADRPRPHLAQSHACADRRAPRGNTGTGRACLGVPAAGHGGNPQGYERGPLRENRAALDLALTRADLADVDEAFSPPHGAQPLEML